MKIIVYDDNPVFGGHQMMACCGIEALAADTANRIVCIIHPDNRALAERLASVNACRILQAPCTSRRFQGVRNHIDGRGIRRLQELLGSLKADRLLCIQGDIEHGSQALIAADRIGLESISYIALPHHLTTMGASFGAGRDILNRGLFRRPYRFIAISRSMASLLRQRGVENPVTVVSNGVALPADPQTSSTRTGFTLGVLGRIEFKQKQQDFMVRTFCEYPQAFKDCRLLIAGNGPDRNRLEQLVTHGPCHTDIDLLPWQNDIDAFFSSIDMLVIPSRFEGVPLVMLEALTRGIPVIGSDRDGMKDLLPDSWTFETGNARALADTFVSARSNWKQFIGPLRDKVRTEHTLEAFRTGFCKAVLQQ